LRKAVNGLLGIIEQGMSAKAFNGNVYLFCNKERKPLKAFWWEKNGFWLSQKRLEKEKFPRPQTNEAAREPGSEELLLLPRGMDFFKAHKSLYCQNVC
jgi:transposase